MSERFIGFVAAARVGGPALAIAFLLGMYLYVEAPLIAFGKRFSKAWFGARKNGKVVVPEAAQALDLPAFHA